eukprot:TRINITY_DN23311_c1_g1_i1.p1 TRINITY_DN23311_c1_g1~~TRINITY_DN23311_c1_g1_i1.p1  ORF type:complete len:269 (+),score=94.96 TRINITY_DN23311_c1_g1_i1:51-857(+)
MRYHPELEPYVSTEVLVAMPIVYLSIVYVLKAFMKNREPMELKMPMMVYNWVQVALSAVMTFQLFKYVSIPNVFGLGLDFTAHAEFWIFVHFLSKALDWFDTIFIVLRKKDRQFSFLHVYHHASIGVVWGWLLQAGYGGGTAFYGAWINSLVHTIMYFHFGWTALGFANPYKKYITTFQISQFYSCMAHALFVVLWDQEHFPMRICSLQLAYHTTMISLFTGFFKETYKKVPELAKKIPAEDVTQMEVVKPGMKKRDTPLPEIPGMTE